MTIIVIVRRRTRALEGILVEAELEKKKEECRSLTSKKVTEKARLDSEKKLR